MNAQNMAEKFENILYLESEASIMRAIVAFQGAGVPLYRRQQQQANLDTATSRLYAAVNALTADEMALFGQYRLTHK